MYAGEPVVIYNLYGQFEEIAALTADTLTRKGHTCTRNNDVNCNDNRLHILFGANVWEDAKLLPKRFIIYQLEQSPIKKWFLPAYFSRLALAEQVWDYNLQNVEYLRARAINAIHVPIGYSALFDPYPLKQAESVDVLFLGQLKNAHRSKILNELRQQGLQVLAANDVFGVAKQKLVAQAKVVLNLHYGGDALLEEARIIPLLSAGKVVISERVSDERYMQLYQGYVEFARDTAHLLQLCREWLSKSAAERATRGLRVRQWVMQTRNAEILFPLSVYLSPPPAVKQYTSLLQVPADCSQAMVDRSLHLLYPDWRAVSHYGHLTLMQRR